MKQEKVYKVVERKNHSGSWVSEEISAGPLIVGGKHKMALIAGPCSIDADDPGLVDEIAAMVKQLGATGFRGGAYKPRTDPYAFRGHGQRALELGRKVCDKYRLAFVTEPVESEHIPLVDELADVVQVGSRNASQGFYRDVARLMQHKKPILAKRGMEQKLLKEYLPMVLNIYDHEKFPNKNVMLCLRGIRTAVDASRFTCDAGDVPILKRECILPVIGDPSHTAGISSLVIEHAKLYMAAGVNGLLIEVHPPGKKPLTDAPQAVSYKQLEEIVGIAQWLGKM